MPPRLMRSITCAAACWAVALAAAGEPRIVSPDSGQTLHDNQGRVAVAVVDVPAGVRLRPLLDGEPAGEPVTAAAFELHDVPRGTHELVIELVDAAGRPVARTEPVEFHVWRASRLFRRP